MTEFKINQNLFYDVVNSKNVNAMKLSVNDTGVNPVAGSAILFAGVKIVSTKAVTLNSKIFVTLTTPGGTIGTNYKASSIVNGTSFTITAVDTAGALVATDTSTLFWFIVN